MWWLNILCHHIKAASKSSTTQFNICIKAYNNDNRLCRIRKHHLNCFKKTAKWLTMKIYAWLWSFHYTVNTINYCAPIRLAISACKSWFLTFWSRSFKAMNLIQELASGIIDEVKFNALSNAGKRQTQKRLRAAATWLPCKKQATGASCIIHPCWCLLNINNNCLSGGNVKPTSTNINVNSTLSMETTPIWQTSVGKQLSPMNLNLWYWTAAINSWINFENHE